MTERADRIPVLLGIDVEPDDHVFPPHSPSPWDAFGFLVAKLSVLRAQLEDLTGNPVAFGWGLRMDPQIALGYGSPTYVVDRYGALIDKLIAAGDEIGIHPHAWRWGERESLWISDHSDQAWLDECLDMSVEAYRAVFGKQPPHHRFGGEHMNSATMRRVGHHGIPLDLTLEPGVPSVPDGPRLGGRLVGGTGDFREIPRGPYRPDPQNFRVPATDGAATPLAIPLTSGAFRRRRYSLQVRARHPVLTTRNTLRPLLKRARHPTRSSEAAEGYQLLAMWKDWRRPTDFWDSAFAAAEQVYPRYMSFAIRSSSGRPNTWEERRFDAITQQLLLDPRARGLHFITPARALAELTQSVSR
jgi:peptidoglycan/xylan/chitin deacetylase (PgdA/CDA1 family)